MTAQHSADVILSEVDIREREVSTESKDPYHSAMRRTCKLAPA